MSARDFKIALVFMAIFFAGVSAYGAFERLPLVWALRLPLAVIIGVAFGLFTIAGTVALLPVLGYVPVWLALRIFHPELERGPAPDRKSVV